MLAQTNHHTLDNDSIAANDSSNSLSPILLGMDNCEIAFHMNGTLELAALVKVEGVHVILTLRSA